jgi:homocitrate synthase NifV
MLIDTTLREGEQLYGVYFTIEDKKEILEGLLALGVDEIEIGNAAQEDLEELLSWAVPRAGRTRISVWSPCRETLLERAASFGVRAANIGIPGSEHHSRARLGLDPVRTRALLARTLKRCRALGFDYLSVGLEDVSRADPASALALGRFTAEHGADRIRLSDTVGVLTPLRTQALVAPFRQALGCALAVHCHNDFGMASANALTALESGADFADVSVLGIGERAGIARLEEVAGCLTLSGGAATYRMEGVQALCRLVAEKARIEIPRIKPLAGRDIFACETGLHIHGMIQDPALFEPFGPNAIHATRRLAFGKKSGRAAIRKALEEMEYPLDQDLNAVLCAVRATSRDKGRPLSREEVGSIAVSFASPRESETVR